MILGAHAAVMADHEAAGILVRHPVGEIRLRGEAGEIGGAGAQRPVPQREIDHRGDQAALTTQRKRVRRAHWAREISGGEIGHHLAR